MKFFTLERAESGPAAGKTDLNDQEAEVLRAARQG
jgi:hypothetical protein